MKTKILTALALAALLVAGGPAFAHGGSGGYSGGGRGAVSGSYHGGSYRGGSVAYGGHSWSGHGYGGHGYGYGYNRGYGGYGWVYPAYAYPDYDYDTYVPDNSNNGAVVYGDTDSSTDSVSVEVQQALAQQGYYKGAIDGEVGPATRGAIAAYQRANGLPVTGAIDGPLLQSLGVD
jgi:hypothetical protein